MGVSFPFAPFHKGLVAVKIGLSQSVLADCSATYWLSHAASFQRQHAIPRPGKTTGLDTSESLPGSIEARCESNGYKHFAVIQQHQGSPAMMRLPPVTSPVRNKLRKRNNKSQNARLISSSIGLMALKAKYVSGISRHEPPVREFISLLQRLKVLRASFETPTFLA